MFDLCNEFFIFVCVLLICILNLVSSANNQAKNGGQIIPNKNTKLILPKPNYNVLLYLFLFVYDVLYIFLFM